MSEDFEVYLNQNIAWQMPRNHFHDTYEVLLVIDGESDFFAGQQLFHLHRGAVVMLDFTALHRSISLGEKEYKRYVLYLPTSFVTTFCTPQTDLLAAFYGNRFLQLEEAQTVKIAALFDRCMGTRMGFGADLRRQNTLIELLICLGELSDLKPAPPQSENIEFQRTFPILKHIEENLVNELSLEILSRRFFISKSHLCRIFKATTGFSVGEYISWLRIMRACRLLRQGRSVQSVGEESGFTNNSHFIRTFGQVIGRSPGRYARDYRGVQHK